MESTLFDFKPESLFETNSPQNPDWVFDKAHVIEYFYHPKSYITPSSEIIVKHSELLRIDTDGKAVNREISSIKIIPDTGESYFRQASRSGIKFRPCGCHIYLAAILQDNIGSPKLRKRAKLPAEFSSKLLRKE